MSSNLKPGARFKSAVCETQVMVVKAPAGEHDLCCGGAPMLALDAEAGGGSPSPEHAEGTQMGKRYVDAEESLELLCTKPGAGSLSLGETPLSIKAAKKLPSSD